MVALFALDGGKFEFDADLGVAESSVTSGAWCDGPAGFIQLFSGPNSALKGWLGSVQFALAKEGKLRGGRLLVGTMRNEGPELPELAVGVWVGANFAVWGYNDQTSGAVADYFSSFTLTEARNGVTLSTEPTFASIVSGPSPAFGTARGSCIVAFESAGSPNARVRPGNQGHRIAAGDMYRSSRVDTPLLYLFSDSASIEITPIAEDSVPNMDRLATVVSSARVLTHAPVG